MEDIIKRLLEHHRLDEMAMKQSEAISFCRSLGKQFIGHYHKIYVAGLEDRDFLHHCREMQTWYNDVRTIKLKTNNKLISKINLVDWFFTAGAGVEDFISDEIEVDSYNDFVLELLATNKKVEDILYQYFSAKEDN